MARNVFCTRLITGIAPVVITAVKEEMDRAKEMGTPMNSNRKKLTSRTNTSILLYLPLSGGNAPDFFDFKENINNVVQGDLEENPTHLDPTNVGGGRAGIVVLDHHHGGIVADDAAESHDKMPGSKQAFYV